MYISGSKNKEPIHTGIAFRHGEPTVVFAQRHQDLLLNCSVEYDSDLGRLEISWSRDGIPLKLGQKGKIQKFNNGSLYIKRFRHRPKKNETNEGHYRCYASLINKDGLVGRIVARDVDVKVPGKTLMESSVIVFGTEFQMKIKPFLQNFRC